MVTMKEAEPYMAKTSAASNLGTNFSDVASYFSKNEKGQKQSSKRVGMTELIQSIMQNTEVLLLILNALGGSSKTSSSVSDATGKGSEGKKGNVFEKMLGATLKQTLGFSSLIGLVVKVLEVLSGGPFKAILSMLSSMFQIVLLPVGMMLLVLFKPVMIYFLKMSINFLKWMQTADASRIMLLLEGFGEFFTAALMVQYTVLEAIMGLQSLISIAFSGLGNIIGTFLSGGDTGAAVAQLGTDLTDKTLEITSNLASGFEESQIVFASAITKISTAIDGTDGLVSMLKSKAPLDALLAFSTYIDNQANADKEGGLAKALGGLAQSAVSSNTLMLEAYKKEAEKIASADLVGVLTDAVLGRIPQPTNSNQIRLISEERPDWSDVKIKVGNV